MTEPTPAYKKPTAGRDYATRRMLKVADSLRRLADDVEFTAVRRPSDLTHTERAQTILHDVIWAVANLNLDGLIRIAEQADREDRQP